ncbi:RNA polymerase sigma factor SigB [Aeribacillus sp. FSL K6-2848]|uniref:RNA polymerase sigma factor SigB n=1 Tax=Aeribacillus sp. FSL K6-2848 TaxID=2954612 RepID=UPI0030F70762
MNKPHGQKRSNNEIHELIRQVQENKDEKAQEQIIELYQPIVVALAKKYSSSKMYQEDLVQVGMIGLLGAIDRFDPTVGKSFDAFVVPTIIGEIKRYLRDKTWSVHVPRRMKELGPKINAAVEQLTSQLERSPKVKEIAEYLGAAEEEVLEAMEMVKNYHTLSVDHSIEAGPDGTAVTILDLVGQKDEGFERILQKLTIENIMHVLTEREKEIILHSFYHNRSQKEIGEILGISQMHVSRLLRQALKKFKKAVHADPMEIGQ